MRTKTSAPPLAAVGMAALINDRAEGFCDSGTESSRSRLTKSQPRVHTALRKRGLFTGMVSPDRRTWCLGMVVYLLQSRSLSGLPFLRLPLSAGVGIGEKLTGLGRAGQVDDPVLDTHDRCPVFRRRLI